jgi:hypothetical protein
MSSQVFSISHIVPGFQLGRPQELGTTGPREVALPMTQPRESLAKLAWAWELRREDPRLNGASLTDIAIRTPNIRAAAKDVLNIINQAAIFSQRPEIQSLITTARDKEFPEILSFIKERRLGTRTQTLYKRDGQLNTNTENLNCSSNGNYNAYIRSEFNLEGKDSEAKFCLEIVKIIEIDGTKLQVNLVNPANGELRIDLRIHNEEPNAPIIPVFQIFMDKTNAISYICMRPDLQIEAANAEPMLAYPAILDVATDQLIVYGSGTGRRSTDPRIANAI